MLNLISNLYIFRNKPFSIVHFITENCNARCKHCFIDFDNKDRLQEELSLNEIKKLTRNLGGSLFNVNLTGGEPFLRRDVFEIAEAYFNNAGVRSILISTNGMFTKEIKGFIDRFIKSKIKGQVIFSVSIDDFEDLHDKYRNMPGLFKNALQTLGLIRDYNRPNISDNVGITIGEYNYNRVIDLYHYLKKNGINNITTFPVREQWAKRDIAGEVKEKIIKTCVILTELIRNDLFKNNESDRRNPYVILRDSKNIILDKIVNSTYLKPRYISRCSAASLFAVIRSNGDVYPCEILDFSIGNLRGYDMDFIKLLSSKNAEECRKKIKDTKCNCVYPCAWTVNILSSPAFLPRLIYNFMKQI